MSKILISAFGLALGGCAIFASAYMLQSAVNHAFATLMPASE